MKTTRMFVTALAAALLLIPTGTAPVAASHTADCAEPADTNRWTGVDQGGQKHGASALFNGQSLDMCTNPEPTWERSGSFAFSNVVNYSHFNDIIQTGVGRCRFPLLAACTWQMEWIATYGRHSSTAGCAGFTDKAPVVYKVGHHDGLAHYYAVYHGGNWWRYLIDGNEVRRTPDSSICWTPDASQWFAESLDIGDAHGGTNANRYRMQAIAWTNSEGDYSTGNWVYASFNPTHNCNIGPGAPPYHCDIVGGTTIDIWTTH